MIRVIVYIVLVALVVAGAVWLAERPGEVVVEWFGWRLDTTVPILLLAVLVFMAVVYGLWRLLQAVGAVPGRVREGMRAKRRRRGMTALSNGYAAVAAGDARRARSYARDAEKLLANPAATRLLSAQAALLAGDRGEAQTRFEALLDDRDTELPALRGLMDLALQAGDKGRARDYAGRAFAKGQPAWAAQALFELQAADGDWAGALATLDAGAKAGAFSGRDAGLLRVTLLVAQAEAAMTGAALWDGIKLAKQAHDADPAFVPAALALARGYQRDGKDRKAAHVLEETWKRAPHPDLAAAYLGLWEGEDALKRVKRAEALAAVNPDNRESRLLVAEAALDAQLWGQARSRLAPLRDEPVGPRFARLMARLEQAEKGDSKAALEWLERAADNAIAGGASIVQAPWHCSRCAHVSRHWAPACPACGSLATVTGSGPSRALVPLTDRATVQAAE
ncbi:heme biosynthesis protein HemY [Caenispirillum bisanense]|uniref:heme biosynthesis protein HemY n=1 Tax=Caenispirillum bisanense TaxID=414052 RepID=UPI0031E495BA